MYITALIATSIETGRSSILEAFAIPLAVLVLLVSILYYIRVGSITAFLLAGVATGPHVLGLVPHSELILGLIEIGAVLLFFLAGTRLGVKHLKPSWPFLQIVGLQVSIAVAVTFLLLVVFGVKWQASLFTGLLASLGSPALVPALSASHFSPQEKPGKLTLQDTLHFQSVFVVFMLLLVPLLAGVEGAVLGFTKAILMMVAFMTLSLILAYTFIPKWLEGVRQRQGREGVLVGVLILCASILLIAGIVGLGLAIAAFLAGIILSGSRYRGYPISEVFPLQLIANLLFFVSLGMLLDLRFLAEYWLLVPAVAGGIFVLKLVIAHGSATSFGIPAGTSMTAALVLVPVGELSFLLFYAGRTVGLTPAGLGAPGEQAFVAVSVLLLVCVPLIARAEPALRRLRSWMDMLWSNLTLRLATPDPLPSESSRSRVASDTTSCTSQDTRNGLCDDSSDPIGLFSIVNRLDKNNPTIRVMTVQAGAPASGFSIGSLNLWQHLGVLVLGLWHRDAYLVNPPALYQLQTGDHVVLSGSPDCLAQSALLFQSMPSSASPDAKT